MKKALAFLLAAMMIVACVGCNTNETVEPTATPATQDPTTTPETTPEATNPEGPSTAAGSVYYLNFKPDRISSGRTLRRSIPRRPASL